jgi:hypothetical protein
MERTIWWTKSYVEIVVLQQVTVLPYGEDYLVDKFLLCNSCITTSNSTTVSRELFGGRNLTLK